MLCETHRAGVEFFFLDEVNILDFAISIAAVVFQNFLCDGSKTLEVFTVFVILVAILSYSLFMFRVVAS